MWWTAPRMAGTWCASSTSCPKSTKCCGATERVGTRGGGRRAGWTVLAGLFTAGRGIDAKQLETAGEEIEFLESEPHTDIGRVALDIGVELGGGEIAADHVAFEL